MKSRIGAELDKSTRTKRLEETSLLTHSGFEYTLCIKNPVLTLPQHILHTDDNHMILDVQHIPVRSLPVISDIGTKVCPAAFHQVMKSSDSSVSWNRFQKT